MRFRPSAVFAAFVAGTLTGAAITAGAGAYPFEKLHVFAEALARIDAHYVDERDPEELVYDAIGGLTQGLDDHSVFLDPERYAQILEQTSGEYFGVGIEVETRDGRILVVAPLEGSPAAEAGILPGDEIVAVDDALISDIGTDGALSRIRGDRGTVVVLGIRRDGEPAPFDISVRRDRVRTRSVESALLDGGYGLVTIERFQRRTLDEVRRALTELEDANRGPIEGIVLDLRGNPGGYLSQAVAIADLWIGEGLIVSTIDRHTLRQRDEAHAAGTDLTTPIVVLVDSASASAAEIVAGALKDHERGKLIGYQTYGKGSVQMFFDLSDGSALKLTTARYYTPAGHHIHGTGIAPDIVLGERGADDPEGDLSGLLDEVAVSEDVAADPEVHVAVAWLVDPVRTEAFFGGPTAALPKAAPSSPE
jgi:carboxyl-terminal processing protease